MKRFIIITAIFIGISIPVWIIHQALTIPTKFKLLLPRNSSTQVDKNVSIVLRIDENEDFYLNEQKTSFLKISEQIDSLSSVGYYDSTIILDADKQVKVETIEQVMNYAQKTNKKILFKSTD